MTFPVAKDLIGYFFRIAIAAVLLAICQNLIEDVQQASLQSQQLGRIGASLSQRIQKLDSRIAKSKGSEQSLGLDPEESYVLYSLGKKISYINDIIVRSQANEDIVEQMEDLQGNSLLPLERQVQEQELVWKLLLSHLKEGQQEGKKKKIVDFCKSNAVGEAEVKDILLHSSSYSLFHFPNQAQEKSAARAAARYEERISNQYRIKAREHEKLHFCIFVEVGNQQKGFGYGSTLRSIIAQGYDQIKVIIIDKGSTDHTVFLLHSFLKRQNVARSKLVIVQRQKGETQSQYLFNTMPLYCQADDIVLVLESGDEVIGKRSFLLVNEVLRGDVATMVQVNSIGSPVDGPLRKEVAPSLIKPDEARGNPHAIDHSFFFFKASAFLQLQEADLKHDDQWLTGSSAYVVPMVEIACSKLTFLGEFMILNNREESRHSSSAEQIKQKPPYHCGKPK